jgi:nicotinate-nucleotide pyrophosphorylase (carboxylating)
MNLEAEVENLIDRAIAEDIGPGDITTEACISKNEKTSGRFVLKQAGILAGLPFLSIIFQKIDPSIKINLLVKEGSYQKAGAEIATIAGPARGILSGERIALNLIQHASGIATTTGRFVRKLAGLPCAIIDTRKTLPGLRALEKYAVKIGGGVNHRFGLNDRCIIKSNHLSFIEEKGTHAIQHAIEKARKLYPSVGIEIEIDNKDQLDHALKTGVDAVILLNISPDEIKKCVGKIRKTQTKVYVESSGTITLDTIRAFAETGVDGISVGALTYSVQDLDIRMRLKTPE